jgi:hypothetical protein
MATSTWGTRIVGEVAALRAAARAGLVPHAGPPVTLDDELTSTVIARARFDRTTGFLVAAVDEGAVELDDAALAQLVGEWQGALTGATLVEALAVRTARQLDDAGVRWRLTKGAALAHLDYPDQVECRLFGDVDLVIHADDWASALDVLLAAGHTRPSAELRPGWDVRFGKGATIVDENDFEIDLHLRFAIGRFGVLAQMDDVFDRCDTIALAGRSIPTLAGPDRFLHACHHLVLGGFSGLRVARDVAQLVLVSRVDWEETVTTAERWGVEAVVASAITQAWDRLALDIEHPALEWAASYPIRRRDARAIEVFANDRPFREQALTAVTALPATSIPGYLRMLIAPAPDARRGRSFAEHVRSRTRALLRR